MRTTMPNKQLNQLVHRLPATGAGVVRLMFHATLVYILIHFILLNIILAGSAVAATFTVNSGYDVNDLDPGNGLCVAYLFINPPFVIPFCSLRAAVEETNALPGQDVILLGSGTYRISIAGIGENQAATGDLDITDSLQIVGAGASKTFIDADGLDRVFDIQGENTNVSFSGLTIINGSLPVGLAYEQKGGGGIRNQASLVLNNVVLSNNNVFGTTSDDVGGGLLNKGACSVTESTIHDNFANGGGGIFNDSLGRLQVYTSTISANSSRGGGGLMNYGSTDLFNTTLSGNSAREGAFPFGGAVLNREQLQIVQCTIAENSADSGGGLSNDGTVSMVNTLLSANVGGNCSPVDDIISQGHNLDSDNTCGLTATDLKTIDPRLGPLRDNGGPTETHALNPGSPALDAGKYLPDITVDQRGIARPQRKAFDIGAFEAIEFSIVPLFTPLLFN